MLLARSAPSSAAAAAAIVARCSSSSSVRAVARSTSIAGISSSQRQSQQQQHLFSTQSASATRKQQPVVYFSSSRRSFLHTSSAAWEKVKVPQMAESITEGTLKQWIKKKGDFVNEGDEIATIETDKIDVSVNAPVSGTISETFSEEEDTVTVGKDLCDIEPGEAPSGGEASSSGGGEEGKKEDSDKKEQDEQKQQEKDQKQQEKDQKEKEKEQTKKTPAEDSKKGEEPANKAPTESSKTSSKPSQQAKTPSPSESEPKTATPGSRNERRVKMSRMRMRIAERLKQSQNTAASLTTFNEIDMSSLMAFRARHKDRVLKEQGVKLGFMSAFAKASALALQDIPAANGRIEGEGLGDTIVYHDYVDLSVAVSTEKGLVTPVVRNLESLSMIQIEQEIAALGKKARDNKLTLEDMAGGTFTISNGGVFGSLFGTPILNLPGSAILGMHAINDKPWVVNGKVEIRPIMVVALTYDHRLLDGREAVTFLVKLKQYIEDMPSMLL